ncbi:hypothetical protein GC163_06580 [bacterium]|nr:hypothetical protein [bacterium]
MARFVRSLWAVCACAACWPAGMVLAQPDADTAPLALPAGVERSPLIEEPKTPAELFDAVVLLVELARFDIAPVYFQAFLDTNPSDADLIALRDKYGTGEFLRFTKIPQLEALAKPLVQRLNQISKAQSQDPGYVDSQLQRLTGPAVEREKATLELRNLGANAVPEMLRQLAVAEDGDLRDAITIALSRMGQPVIAPLIAALDSPIDRVSQGCIEALMYLNSEEAVLRLWPMTFSEDFNAGIRDTAAHALAKIRFGNAERTRDLSKVVALHELQQRANALLTRDLILVPEVEGQPIVVWSWDNEQKTVVSTEKSPDAASLDEALRLSRDAFRLNPEQARLQTMYLAALLAHEVERAGWDTILTADTSPAMQTAVSTGVVPLQDVLKLGMEMGRTDVVWAALQGLSAIASPELLQPSGGQPSPVISALNYPDARVQFAAASVILRTNPRGDFRGATRVTEILRRALTDPGQARGLVIDSDRDESTLLGTYLASEGYDPLQAFTGKEGFTKAAELAGIELVVVQTNISNWALTQTLANLRADARTAHLPIVVYGPEDVRKDTARLVKRTGNAMFAGESPAAESFWWQVGPFLQSRRTPPMSPQLRSDFRAIATYWLATLSSARKEFDVTTAEPELLPLIPDPALSPNVLAALGQIGTAEVQTRLADWAFNDQASLNLRAAAAERLVAHINHFGLVLSPATAETLQQRLGQPQPSELSGAYAAIMGCLKPNPQAVGERLRNFAPTP